MDPVGQGSFIPKQSLAAAGRGGGMGLFFLLAIIIFALSIVSAGAAFGYTQILKNTIASKDESLRKAEGAFNPGTIQDLLRLDNRLTQARLLLQKHVAPSALLYFLSTITLERVQLNSFEMGLNNNGSASLTVTGSADSFSSVALQSDQFGATKLLKDVIFSGISVNESGKIGFTVTATVDPSLMLYSSSITQQDDTTASSSGQTP